MFVNHSGFVQLDSEIESDPICSSSGCNQYKHPKPADEPPRDYPVPNFGQDHEIRDSLANERLASSTLNHNWVFGTEESKEKWKNKAKETEYNFSPKLDGDMVDTIRHMNAAGGMGLAQRKGAFMQMRSDPICASSGCNQYKHPKDPAAPPMDYPVADFGDDHEILDSIENEKIASKRLGHSWVFGTEESKAQWHNAAKDTDYNFYPKLDSDIVDSISNQHNAVNFVDG